MRSAAGAAGPPFADLASAEQTEVLRDVEKKAKAFFDLILAHTMQGFYGDPRHGGNREAVSWKMLALPFPPVGGEAEPPYETRQCSDCRVRAAGIVAKELALAGLSVVLLERGKWYTAADCRKDDLRNQRTTTLGNAFGPDDEGNPRVLWTIAGVSESSNRARAAITTMLPA